MKTFFLIITIVLTAFKTFAINTPTQISPANGSTNQNVNVTLWINTVSGASNYDYQLDTVATFDSQALVEFTHTSAYSGWSPTDLYYNKTYYWRIRARNSTETSDWSAVWSFSTKSLGAIQNSPTNSTVSASVSLTLSITGYGSRNYEYQLDTVPTFDSPYLKYFQHTNAYSGQTVTNLHYGKKYYWRVRGNNNISISDWSSTWEFTTNQNGAWQTAPTNNATDGSVGLTLSIGKISGNSLLEYQLDTVPTFDSPHLREYSHSDSYSGQSVINLHYKKKYYWRVRGRNSSDVSQWSSTWNFTTYQYGAWQTAPTNNATGVGVSLTLSIGKISGNSLLEYQLDTVPTFDSPHLREYSHSDSYSGQSVINLHYKKKYYWRVRGRNSSDVSQWSSTWNFTTYQYGAWQTAPTNNVTGVGVSITLSIGKISGNTLLEYQLDTVPTFNSPFLSEFSHSDTYSSRTVYNLNYGKKYYWRVRGRNNSDVSEWSAAWNFTTYQYGAWQTSPTNFATDRGVSLTLSVGKISGNEFIDYQVDTVPTFNSPYLSEFSHSDTYSSRTVYNLYYGKKYYWRVRGRNNSGISPWSSTWEFTTYQYGAWQASPANGSIDRNVSLTLSVGKISGNEFIDYQLDTVPTFNSPYLSEFSHSDTYSSRTIYNLYYGKKYYWRVRGRNNSDISQWSSTWEFTTYQYGAWQGTPTNGSTGRPINLGLSVGMLTGTNYIQYQIDTTPYYNSAFLKEISHSSNYSSTNVSNLRYGQTYYWRVRGGNDTNVSGWSVNWTFTTQYELTNAPTLVSPTNNSVNISYQTFNLIWNTISNANYYQYQVSTDINFNTIIKNGSTSLSFTSITNLYPATNYYWRVRGENVNGYSPWSEVWTLKTESAVLVPPALLTPNNAATNQSTNTVFTWENVFGALQYILNVSFDNTFAIGVSSFTTSGLTYTVNGLPENSTFYWRVKSSDGTMESDWSDVWSFTTGLNQLGAPNLVSPANNATNQLLNLNLSWNSVANATQYEYIWGIDNTFSTNLGTGIISATTQSISCPSHSTDYYWKVRAKNSTQTSEWSQIWKFTTKDDIQALVAPNLVSPINNAINQPLNLNLIWNSVANATEYEYVWGTDNTFTTNLGTGIISTTAQLISCPSHSTDYYWKVRAKNSTQTSDWSQIWKFATEDDIQALVAPSLVSPINNAINQPLNLNLIWNSVANATQYEYIWGTDNAFTTNLGTGIISATTQSISCPSHSTDYYWKVRAKNSTQTSEWSQIWKFTTQNFVGFETHYNQNIMVYPNPTNGVLNINVENANLSNPTISVIDITGNIIKQIEYNNSLITIDLSNLKHGIYFFRISDESNKFMLKFVKM